VQLMHSAIINPVFMSLDCVIIMLTKVLTKMLTKIFPVVVLLVLQTVTPLWAGTVIISRDLEGEINKLLVDGSKVRIELNDSGYMLVDLKKNTFYTVEPDEERIIDMSSFYTIPLDKISAAEGRISLHFEKVGKGAKVAGFNTTRYKMMINEYVCADVFLSRQAFALADMKTLFKVYVHMSGREAALGVSGDGDPCERVEFEMTESQYKKLGIPMRTVGRDGHTEHEFMDIKSEVTIAKKIFKLPKSYKTLAVENLHKLLE